MKPAALYDHVCNRFREVFGEPHNVLSSAVQWSLHTSAGSTTYILINATGEHPTVWIFDPSGMYGQPPATVITRENDVGPVIARVQQSLKQAEANPMAATLRDFPVRIEAFVNGVRGWTDEMTSGKGERAKAETEKVRLFGRFIAEDKQFADIYRQHVTEDCRGVNVSQALNSMCTFLNSVADVVVTGPSRGPRWAPR